MLRVQLLGDLFKVVAWAIGLPILASGRVGTHLAPAHLAPRSSPDLGAPE